MFTTYRTLRDGRQHAEYGVRHEIMVFVRPFVGCRPLPRPLDKVTVRVRLDSSVDVHFQGKKLQVQELIKTPKKEAAWHPHNVLQGTFLLCVDTA
ncbi:MAG: hypothetical protein Pg6C_11780 [Treponemataceae bacterium]|nr:MAG: hypothetical protein Pg6C_11780 [Treponemataceae bacterium]